MALQSYETTLKKQNVVKFTYMDCGIANNGLFLQFKRNADIEKRNLGRKTQAPVLELSDSNHRRIFFTSVIAIMFGTNFFKPGKKVNKQQDLLNSFSSALCICSVSWKKGLLYQ
ncbi:ABC transporter G family member 39 [Iris pallida]|uniref:ABC transporter G family member 39 n=1 Tax=Iris pallida TaxID=29817 RepID=A0AAX6HIZ0_IRIPA|nr:ABC transporter G family member 39 [Iris pallida]